MKGHGTNGGQKRYHKSQVLNLPSPSGYVRLSFQGFDVTLIYRDVVSVWSQVIICRLGCAWKLFRHTWASIDSTWALECSICSSYSTNVWTFEVSGFRLFVLNTYICRYPHVDFSKYFNVATCRCVWADTSLRETQAHRLELKHIALKFCSIHESFRAPSSALKTSVVVSPAYWLGAPSCAAAYSLFLASRASAALNNRFSGSPNLPWHPDQHTHMQHVRTNVVLAGMQSIEQTRKYDPVRMPQVGSLRHVVWASMYW